MINKNDAKLGTEYCIQTRLLQDVITDLDFKVKEALKERSFSLDVKLKRPINEHEVVVLQRYLQSIGYRVFGITSRAVYFDWIM